MTKEEAIRKVIECGAANGYGDCADLCLQYLKLLGRNHAKPRPPLTPAKVSEAVGRKPNIGDWDFGDILLDTEGLAIAMRKHCLRVHEATGLLMVKVFPGAALHWSIQDG